MRAPATVAESRVEHPIPGRPIRQRDDDDVSQQVYLRNSADRFFRAEIPPRTAECGRRTANALPDRGPGLQRGVGFPDGCTCRVAGTPGEIDCDVPARKR